jgi:methylated-DNA-[protein]-cysteine S-methyltransferase
MPTTTLSSPIGHLRVSVDASGLLVAIRLTATLDPVESTAAESPALQPAVSALGRYFAGELDAIDDLAVAPDHGTEFQRSVWDALRRIPTGETISYADLAAAVGRPSAFRAVGSANGANPIPIVVPCHRVVNADGALGGYALGLDVKRWLLAHEGALASAPLPGVG